MVRQPFKVHELLLEDCENHIKSIISRTHRDSGYICIIRYVLRRKQSYIAMQTASNTVDEGAMLFEPPS